MEYSLSLFSLSLSSLSLSSPSLSLRHRDVYGQWVEKVVIADDGRRSAVGGRQSVKFHFSLFTSLTSFFSFSPLSLSFSFLPVTLPVVNMLAGIFICINLQS